MRIYLHGRDNAGWSIDWDRRHTERFLRDIGHRITNNLIAADIIHSVWWNQLLAGRYYLLRFKKRIIATATNRIDLCNKDYLNAKRWVTLWIAPNKEQLHLLENDGVEVAYQPFYVDETVFKKLETSRVDIASSLGIEYDLIRDKFLIGSFQRDTLGTDLVSPKWQKNPQLLIDILSALPYKDKWLLVLAGPRRHFVIRECRKKGIPHYFYGTRLSAGFDDLRENIIERDKIALLYNLIDCYIVSSKSEGGPKAVIEASLSKTLIYSTAVGLAPDILDTRCIYSQVDTVIKCLATLIKNENQRYFDELRVNNYNNVRFLCSYDVVKRRWKQIYDSI